MDEILRAIELGIKELPKKKMDKKEQEFVQHYLGSERKVLGAKTSEVIKIAKDIVKRGIEDDVDKLVSLLSKLFRADSFEEYAVGGKIFTLIKPETRSVIPMEILEKWLEPARGWVEVDVICQSAYTGDEVLKRFDEWNKTIRKFRSSKNISLRRASLVLQTKPIKETGEVRLREIAFETIEELKGEKEILITKAISWLLRNMTKYDKAEVLEYIKRNEKSLPRIAVRETLKKIETGVKNSRKG